MKAEIISSNTQLDCNGDSDGSFCFFAEGGWTQPFDNNPINTPETGWGNPYTFSLLNTTTGVTYNSGSVNNSFDSSGNQIGFETCFNNLPAGSYTLTVTEFIVQNPYSDEVNYSCSEILDNLK